MNSILSSLKTDLQRLNQGSPAPFSDKIIHNFDEYLRERGIYLLPESQSLVMDIPLDKVIGIDQMYGGNTWGQCLSGYWLKRLERNLLELERNPDYYLCSNRKHDISFIKIGEDYFIKSGKHRTIIARFLAHFNQDTFKGLSPLRNASVTEYFIDKEYIQMKSELAKVETLYPELEFELRHTTSLEDSKFLYIRKIKGLHCGQCFTRSQFGAVLGDLHSPQLKNKLKADLDGMFSERNVYKLISYSKCLKALYGEMKFTRNQAINKYTF